MYHTPLNLSSMNKSGIENLPLLGEAIQFFGSMWISVGAGFLFYWGLLITSLYYKHLWMDRNDKPKRIIVLGGNPDPERVI